MPRKQRFKPSRKSRVVDDTPPAVAPPAPAPLLVAAIPPAPRGAAAVLPDHVPEPKPVVAAPHPIPRGRDAVIDD